MHLFCHLKFEHTSDREGNDAVKFQGLGGLILEPSLHAARKPRPYGEATSRDSAGRCQLSQHQLHQLHQPITSHLTEEAFAMPLALVTTCLQPA